MYSVSNVELKLVLIVILKIREIIIKIISKGDHPLWNNKVTPIGLGSLNEKHGARHWTSRSYWSGKLNKTLNQQDALNWIYYFYDYVCKFLILSENT